MARISLPSRIFGTVKSFTLRGMLLEKDELQTLAESRDMDELITRLKNTRYIDAASRVQKPYTAEAIEQELKLDLVNYHARMGRIAGESEVIDAYFMRYIIWNIKLILKGKALKKPDEEIQSKLNLRAEELLGRRDIVVRALVAKDLDEAAATLSSSEFGEDAQKAVAIFKERNDIQIFDTFLDHAFYKKLNKALSISREEPDTRALIIPEIDAYHILTLLRSKFWGLDEQQISELIVSKTPSLPANVIEKMISAANVQDAISELANSAYRDLVQQYSDIEAISHIENALEKLLLKRYLATFTSVFKHSNIITAIKLKAIEVRNLSAIAAAVEQHIPPDVVMSRLLLP